jgi:hypothetical protein
MNDNIKKYIQHIADQAPTYSYTSPQEVEHPTVQDALEDIEKWQHSKDSKDNEEEVSTEQAIGPFGPEHILKAKHKCQSGYKW